MAETKKPKGGSLQDAQEQASTPLTVERQAPERWAPGKYVLLADRYQPIQDGLDYQKGDLIELKESDAQRLGRAGAIALPDSTEAKRASAHTSEELRAVRIEEMESELDRLRSESAPKGEGDQEDEE